MAAGMDGHPQPFFYRTRSRVGFLPSRLPADGFGSLPNTFLHPVARKRKLSVLVAVLKAGIVLHPEIHRIHPQLLRNHIHMDFLGELGHRMSHASHECPLPVYWCKRSNLQL